MVDDALDKECLRVATRRSDLALFQTRLAVQKLKQQHPEINTQEVLISTEGDQRLDVALSNIGGKGLFIKSLEKALIAGEADFAVHSVKDLPAKCDAHFSLVAMLPRDDVRDVFVSNQYESLLGLPQHAVVGTASPRRHCQLLAVRPDLNVKLVRGNVQTRLSKLDNGEYDAIILAAAGLHRLDLQHRITEYLSAEQFIPAVGQGVIGVEICADNHKLQSLFQSINDEKTHRCVALERLVAYQLEASCHTPLGVYARYEHNQLIITGMLGTTPGEPLHWSRVAGDDEHRFELVNELVDQLCFKKS